MTSRWLFVIKSAAMNAFVGWARFSCHAQTSGDRRNRGRFRRFWRGKLADKIIIIIMIIIIIITSGQIILTKGRIACRGTLMEIK